MVDKGCQRLSQLARMHAHMCQGLGQHRRAISILTAALDSDLSPDATVECLHLRGEPRACKINTTHESTARALRQRGDLQGNALPPGPATLTGRRVLVCEGRFCQLSCYKEEILV